MSTEWNPDAALMTAALSQLQQTRHLSGLVARTKQQELKDIRAIYALSQIMAICTALLPPEVADEVRQQQELIQGAYQRHASPTNERPSEQLQPDQSDRF